MIITESRKICFKFKDLGVKIKVHYLFSHLNHFPANLVDSSEEHKDMFHQDNSVMEEWHQSRWDAHMMVSYCWSLQQDCLRGSHSRVLQRNL